MTIEISSNDEINLQNFPIKLRKKIKVHQPEKARRSKTPRLCNEIGYFVTVLVTSYVLLKFVDSKHRLLLFAQAEFHNP